MTVIEILIVSITSLLIGAFVMYRLLKQKTNTYVAGDLHIFPNEYDENGYTVCYVAWERDPRDLLGEKHITLKVIDSSHSQE